MSLSEFRREQRRNHLTATDVPAILGFNPWRTASQVWIEKVRPLAPEPPSEDAEAGTRLETCVVDWAADVLGYSLVRNQFRIGIADALFSASYDALVVPGGPGPVTMAVEAKTAGIRRGFVPHEQWGDAGTDEVPPYVRLQCQAQIQVLGLERVWVPALLGGRGFCLYQVTPDTEMIDVIRTEGRAWWEKYVVTDTPPPEAIPDEDLLKRIVRPAGKTVEIGTDLVQTWLVAKERAKEAESTEFLAKGRLINALGDAEIGLYAGGQVTYKTQSGGRRLDGKTLAAEHPELAAVLDPYYRETRFPVLRHKAAKVEVEK